jgi:hypothetical protein
MTEWQDIKTAPLDGTLIIGLVSMSPEESVLNPYPALVRWWPDMGGDKHPWVGEDHNKYKKNSITHW